MIDPITRYPPMLTRRMSLVIINDYRVGVELHLATFV